MALVLGIVNFLPHLDLLGIIQIERKEWLVTHGMVNTCGVVREGDQSFACPPIGVHCIRRIWNQLMVSSSLPVILWFLRMMKSSLGIAFP